jgi:hypothetical protein
MEKHLTARPEASAISIESLILHVKRGQVRIPGFQRPLRWEAPQVVALFDSIYKGYPIGSLLLQKRQAEASEVTLGPLQIMAPAVHDALWVVDGQQRLTSLAAGLARPIPVPTTPDDPFVVYFDAKECSFLSPNRNGLLPSTWVPVAQLLDASSLIEWVFGWQHSQDSKLRAAVFEAGTRIRQYQVPIYVIETEDENVLRDIFERTNTFGKVMDWVDVHKALFGKQGPYPSTLLELSDELATKGMGQMTEQQLLTLLLAFEGLDPTRNLAEHRRRGGEQELQKLQTSVFDALPVIGRALDFLNFDAEIPHLRLLARMIPLPILVRYFRLFPQPSSRSRQLLTRWTWRLLMGCAMLDERSILRKSISILVGGNDELQAQSLLGLVPNDLPHSLYYQLPNRFDARSADSRLALWGLYSQQPMLKNRQYVLIDDVEEAVQEQSRKGWPTIINNKRMVFDDMPSAFGPANRILLPDAVGLATWLLNADWQENADFLMSHIINSNALDALHNHDREGFLYLRGQAIEQVVRLQSNRLAAWGQSDRISIDQIAAKTQLVE